MCLPEWFVVPRKQSLQCLLGCLLAMEQRIFGIGWLRRKASCNAVQILPRFGKPCQRVRSRISLHRPDGLPGLLSKAAMRGDSIAL